MSMNRARKGSQDTTQEVEIYFNFVGRYIPPAMQPVPLTPRNRRNCGKRRNARTGLHRNYLRRKANGKQKEWEERYNAKRKAQMEAAKAAIRAEDMAKGIYTTVSQFTPSGTAQGCFTGQHCPLITTTKRRSTMKKTDLYPLWRLLHPAT